MHLRLFKTSTRAASWHDNELSVKNRKACLPFRPLSLVFLSTHGGRQGVDISVTVSLCVCVFVCLFVRLRISPPRIKLAASHFARRFIGVQDRESHILRNFAPPQKPEIGQIGQRVGHAHPHVNITVDMH